MQQDPAGSSATLSVRNAGEGFTQAMTFGTAQTCGDAHVLGDAMRPGASATYKVAAGRMITLSMGAFGLNADPQHIGWCKPGFVSARLQPGRSYELSYRADVANHTGTGQLVDAATGAKVAFVRREGQGGQFSGAMSTPSCTPDPAIDRR